MVNNSYLGLFIVSVNILVLLMLPFAVRKYLKSSLEGVVDISRGFLLISVILAQPVLIYENLIFIDKTFFPLSIPYSLLLLKVTFLLAMLAIIFFNLQLLLLEGLPDWPISLLMIIMGFSGGSMVVGLQLDRTSSTPIFYNPLYSGLIFIGGLMLFNVIGLIGLSIAMRRMKEKKSGIISKWHILAALTFFVGPLFVFATRIIGVPHTPLNLLFFPFLLAFLIELVLYLTNVPGYPILGEIHLLAVLDRENQIVIGGFQRTGGGDWLRLTGMAMLAADAIVQSMVADHLQERTSFIFGYDMIIFVEYGQYLLVISLDGEGIPIAKFCGMMYLKRLSRFFPHSLEQFRRIILQSFNPFLSGKKIEINRFFFSEPVNLP